MGMSADYETAVRLGATHVRVGSALFGSAALGSQAMPELPEVETVRRGLIPRMVGHRIVRLTQRRKDLRVPLPANFAQRVEGRTILAIDRRAKYLLLRLDDGQTLIAHLGMSGRMTLHDAAERRRASVRAARPCRVRDRRWLAGSFQRRTPLRADAAGGRRGCRASTSCSRGWVPSRSTRPSMARRSPRRLKGRAHADQGGAARSEDPGRRRQYLRLRGAVPVRHLAAPLGPHRPGRARRPPGRRHQAGAAALHRRRRLDPARPCPAGRRARLFPDALQCL